MFVEPQFTGPVPMKTFSLDVSTGYRGAQHTVSGFDDFGEITRKFMWNAKAKEFLLLQANFTGDNPSYGGPITLFRIDAQSGQGVSKKVSGATSEVTGYALHEASETVYFATYASSKKQSYNFYTLDLKTNAATKISTHNFGSSDDFAGWFTAISEDGKSLFRLGYRDVVSQSDSGLAVIDISQDSANVTFHSVAAPSGHNFFVSFNLYNSEFLSLAPDAYGSLSLFKWNIASPASKIADVGGYQTPYFGPIAEAVSIAQNYYAAVVVEHEIDHNYDRWGVVFVDLKAGSSIKNGVWPYMLAETDSVSGFGFA